MDKGHCDPNAMDGDESFPLHTASRSAALLLSGPNKHVSIYQSMSYLLTVHFHRVD